MTVDTAKLLWFMFIRRIISQVLQCLGSIYIWCGTGLKKMDPDPDPGHFFKIYWIFLTKNYFRFFFLAYFYPKTWWTVQKWGHFYNLSFFSKVQIWVLGVQKFFFAVFGWYFTPWIRIRGSAYFCGSGSGSRKPNSCGSNGSGS